MEKLLGLPLSVARGLCVGEIVVVSTAPPFFSRGYTPHFGEERVVRVRALAEGKTELLVAGELIGEDRAFSQANMSGKADNTR